MNAPTAYFTRGGVRIAYDRAGDGPLVVFLHGVGGNRTNWVGQLARLGSGFTCVAWDARGYGASDDPEETLVFDDFARDLESLLDHLGAERAHLVGLSMGGYIAQDFHARFPARVASLTLASTSAGANLLSAAEREDFLAKRLRPLESGASMADVARGLVDVLAGRRADAAIRARLRQSLEALRPDAYRQTLRALVTTDFRDSLVRILVPTLVVVGEDDRVLPVAESRYIAERVKRSRMVVIERAGHLCNIEAPDEFDAALLQLLCENHTRASSLACDQPT
ncbi:MULTISPECIES: alpha/beta fold hydrolase [unclassified Variovorax]|uniref:alpha/beta fold hydrolase n=1 Tax=unclassified Variovorax TaxID=663243 RepID=UPI001BD43C16|nr:MULTISPECIES: alpha/beta fold hydrolase [unclassified Variovorax]